MGARDSVQNRVPYGVIARTVVRWRVGCGADARTGCRGAVPRPVEAPTHDTLRRAQNLLRHAIPSGDLAAIFDRALTLLVADLEVRKAGATHERVRIQLIEPSVGLGRRRWVVERTFAWLNQFPRLRVRYDRRADIHEARSSRSRVR